MPFNTRGKSARGIPSFDITTDSFEDTRKVIKAFSDNLSKTFGTFLAPLGVGLAVGALYFNDILFNRELGCFPMLFVQGSWQSGKTEYMSMLMRMFGLEKSDIESLQDITSTVPVTRRLSYYSNVPIFYDEYRDNSPRIQQIVGTLRSAYDGSGRSLGVKGSFGVVSEIIRAPVMLAGEHIPTDEAFKSRLIPIQVREAWRKPEFHAEAVQTAIDSNRHLYNCIRFKTKETTKELIARIFDIKRRIKTAKPHLGERALKNYAIALGCYSYLVSNDDPVLFDSVIEGTGIQQLDRDTEEPDQQDPNVKRTLNEFIDIVELALESKRIITAISWYHIVETEDRVFIWITPLYEAYAETCRRQGQTPVNLQTILMHFRDSDCFIDSHIQHKMPVGETFKTTNKKCLVLRLSNLNSGVRNWIGGEM